MKKFSDENTDIVCLFKPQFEYGKKVKNGVIKDPKIHEALISDFTLFAQNEGFSIESQDVSPILGGDGNKEFLFHIILK